MKSFTATANHAYTGVTVHFLSKSFELHHYLLETREFPTTPSGANIANEIECVLMEWDIDMDKVTTITSDNRANIISVVQMMGLICVPCFSHTLQLALEKVLKIPAVIKAIARCKCIVTHFNHSNKSSYLLKEKQISLGHKQHCLIEDVATRWNSAIIFRGHGIDCRLPFSGF